MWQWSSSAKKIKKRADVAAPPPDPKPFEAPKPFPNPPVYYVQAIPDYSANANSPNYLSPTTQAKAWVDKGAVPTGFRPSPKVPPGEWGGYHQDNYWRSINTEQQVNGREGLPLQQYHRYHSALNPYWYKIPDTRIQRAPHEYDFERPFDQGTLGERQLNGMHYSAATTGLTTSPSMSLKGMQAPLHRTSTFRLEPTQWGENTVLQAARVGPPSAVYNSPDYSFGGGVSTNGTYRLT